MQVAFKDLLEMKEIANEPGKLEGSGRGCVLIEGWKVLYMYAYRFTAFTQNVNPATCFTIIDSAAFVETKINGSIIVIFTVKWL